MNPLSTRPNRWRLVTVSNLLVGMLFSFVALAQPAFLKEGLVAYYPFNGNANDESGNGKNGQLNGVQFANDRYGSGTSSAAFDGSKYIGLPEISPTLGQPKASFTVSLWVKPSPKVANFFISATTDNSYQFCRVGSGSDNRVNIYHRGGGQNNEAAGNIILKPGEWNSVVYKTDGINGLGSVFINGTRDAGLDFKYDSSVNYNQPNRTWAIGTTLNTTCGGCNPYYQGGIDDVRIYNRALSDGEVKALYDYESTPPYNNFITNGLVAYYPFNGNANDESGNKYTGTETGLTYTADRFSRNGSSPLFNGVSSVVHLPINNWAAPEYSINCWVKGLYSENSEDLKGLVYSRPEGTDNINGLCFSPTGPWGPGFRADASSLEAWNLDHSTARNGNWWWAQIGNQPTLLDNNWRMITAVYRFNTKSPTIEIYHNGNLIETSPAPKNPIGQITLSSLRIGTDHISRRTFKGNIDDVRLYARALDASQVKALYDYESKPPDNNFITKGLVAYYPFNGNANDESGNGNTASLNHITLNPDRLGGQGNASYQITIYIGKISCLVV